MRIKIWQTLFVLTLLLTPVVLPINTRAENIKLKTTILEASPPMDQENGEGKVLGAQTKINSSPTDNLISKIKSLFSAIIEYLSR